MEYEAKVKCCVCLGSVKEFLVADELRFLLPEGDKFLDPCDLLQRICSDEGIHFPKDCQSLYCKPCASDLQTLAAHEYRYRKLKSQIFEKLKHLAKPQQVEFTRPKTKPNRFVKEDQDTEDENEQPELKTLINEVIYDERHANEESVIDFLKTYIKNDLSQLYSACTFSKLHNSQVKCLSKQCSLEVSFQTGSGKIFVFSKGHCSGKDYSSHEDPDRVMFELTKSEYRDEDICEYCCESFQSEELLNQHQVVHTEATYICPTCKAIEFKTLSARNNHFLVAHTQGEPYLCQNKDCNKSFKTKNKRSYHERTCLGGPRFNCGRCDKTFASQRNLTDHLKVVHEKDVANYMFDCEHCGKKFYKRCNYDSHVISHQPRHVRKMFKCDQCGQSFKRSKNLKLHKEAKHLSNGLKKAYLCSMCGQCLESYTGYRQHLAKHTGGVYVQRKYQCSNCNKSFRSPSDLKIHEVVHTKDKAFTCDICNEKFTQKASLKDHCNVHLKKFVCSVCNKAFGRQRYLNNHEKSCGHTKKKTDNVQITQDPTIILINEEGEPTTFQQVSIVVASDSETNAFPHQASVANQND